MLKLKGHYWDKKVRERSGDTLGVSHRLDLQQFGCKGQSDSDMAPRPGQAVLNLGCMFESPGELLKMLMPGSHC